MSDREKKPPINLEDEPIEESKQGSLSYADNGKAKRSKGPGLAREKKPAMGILMMFIPILVSVVIAYLLVTQYAPSKGAYSKGITDLQTTVNQQLEVQGAKVESVINNYASKTDLGGYATRTEVAGLVTSSSLTSSLSGYATKADLAGLLKSGDLSGYLKAGDLDSLLTKSGANATYVTKAELAAAVATLKALIGTGGLGAAPTLFGTGTSEYFGIMVDSVGTYVGTITLSYSIGADSLLGAVVDIGTPSNAAALFYVVVAGDESITLEAAIAKYTPTFQKDIGGIGYYLKTVVAKTSGFALDSANPSRYISLLGLQGFGGPSTITVG